LSSASAAAYRSAAAAAIPGRLGKRVAASAAAVSQAVPGCWLVWGLIACKSLFILLLLLLLLLLI
jgi:dolichol kinase